MCFPGTKENITFATGHKLKVSPIKTEFTLDLRALLKVIIQLQNPSF